MVRAGRATVVADIHARGRRPLLVGGSGLYVEAARAGTRPVPPIDPAVRERIAPQPTRRDHEEHSTKRLARVVPSRPRASRRAIGSASRAPRGVGGNGQPL